MKPVLYLSFCLALFTTVCLPAAEPEPKLKSTEVTYKELKWVDDVYFLNGQAYTGIARDKYKDGKLKGEYPFHEGRLHGVVREWWENGQLSTETNFDHGKRHGLNRYWSKAGQLTKEQVYEQDKSVSEKHYETKD
jgi:antitoxin component YwqK of YwqJK toxin-antitoxin module